MCKEHGSGFILFNFFFARFNVLKKHRNNK